MKTSFSQLESCLIREAPILAIYINKRLGLPDSDSGYTPSGECIYSDNFCLESLLRPKEGEPVSVQIAKIVDSLELKVREAHSKKPLRIIRSGYRNIRDSQQNPDGLIGYFVLHF